MELKRHFSLDRKEAKLLGVCSGLGRHFAIDPTFIRIVWVAVPLLTFVDFSTAGIAYVVAGIIGAVGRNRAERSAERKSDYERMGEVGKIRPSVHAMRTELDETDRRMMAIDHQIAAQKDHDLAREIEALREKSDG